MSPYTELIWKFLRDDISVPDFEQWVYGTFELENFLGAQIYFQAIVCDYRNPEEVWELKQLLKSAIDQIEPRQCYCPTWKDDQKVPISIGTGWETIRKGFENLRKRTPWLELSQCKHCGQFWYVALDTIEDDYYLHRLTAEEVEKIITKNVWPLVFDERAALWPSNEWLNKYGYSSLKDWQSSNKD